MNILALTEFLLIRGHEKVYKNRNLIHNTIGRVDHKVFRHRRKYSLCYAIGSFG